VYPQAIRPRRRSFGHGETVGERTNTNGCARVVPPAPPPAFERRQEAVQTEWRMPLSVGPSKHTDGVDLR